MAKSSGGAVNKIPWLHHTSHQAGGTDPISLAGLAGIPTALTTHAGVVTGVHGLKGEVSFYVYRATGGVQAVPSGVATKLLFDTMTFGWDTGGYFDWANSRFQPLIAGLYLIICGCEMIGLANGNYFEGKIQRNGADYTYLWGISLGADASPIMSGSALVPLNGTTQYVECFVQHNFGFNRDARAINETTYMMGFLIAQT
jgi:hypothetical protein